MKGFSKALWHFAFFKKKLVLLCGVILHAVVVVVSGVVGKIVVSVALCACHASVKGCVNKFKAGL